MSSHEPIPHVESVRETKVRLRESLESAAQDYLRSKGSVGLVAGAIDSGDRVTWCGGTKRIGAVDLPDERTLFEIGSLTKVFTTTLLADIHLKNEVQLDDPVNKLLPSSVRLPSPKGIDITLRHLATHTSGLPRLPENLEGANFDINNPYANYTVDDLYAGLAKLRLKTVPGTSTDYSNLGMGLLGHVLALVAGQEYETLVKERICSPLGMSDTTIRLSTEQQQRLAPGHSGNKPAANWDIPTLAGAGAFRSTLHDLLRFLEANIDRATTPLAPSLELAQQIQIEAPYHLYGDFGCVGPLVVAGLSGLFAWQSFGLPLWARIGTVALVPAVLFFFWPEGLSTMTLGWHVDEMLTDKPVLWHNGGTGGYASFMAFRPDTRQGVIVLANSDTEPDPMGRKLLKEMAP